MSTAPRPHGPVGVRDRIAASGANPPGVIMLAVGAVLVLAAFTVLDWFRGRVSFPGTSSTGFGDVRAFLDEYRDQIAARGLSGYFSFGAAGPYFVWLGWVALIAALAASGLAVSRHGRSRWSLRWLGAVVSATAAGVTLMSLDLIIPQGNPPTSLGLPGFGDYVANSSVGAWSAIAGFLLMVGASLLPHR